MTKGEAVGKMKNTDLKVKNRQQLSRKKVNFVIMMTKNAPETKAKHKKVLRKKNLNSTMKIVKRVYKSLIGIGICLKRINYKRIKAKRILKGIQKNSLLKFV